MSLSSTPKRQHAATDNETEPGAILSDPEAHDFLRLKHGTLPRWRTEGRGPAWSYLGRRVVYLRADLLAFVAANRVVPSGLS